MKKLIDRIEKYGFACEAGSIKNCVEWIELKNITNAMHTDSKNRLRQLPDELLEKFYSLDIINLKGRMQYNSFLADRYRKYRVLSHSESFLEFKVGNWIVQMETED